MYVQGLGHFSSIEPKAKLTLKKAFQADTRKENFPVTDTVEISSTGSTRTALLEQIRQKIKTGFYNSESVLEDLSHGFANSMGQGL
ncbi:MAG: hypothetical protein GX556_15300 [Fibrobacter sp.]|nr:hypothetical protein [Fibrobacter sp.]